MLCLQLGIETKEKKQFVMLYVNKSHLSYVASAESHCFLMVVLYMFPVHLNQGLK